MTAKTKRSGSAGARKRGGIIAVLIGLKQSPGFPGGVTVAAGDISGDGIAPKLKR